MKNKIFVVLITTSMLIACDEYEYIPDNMKFKYKQGDTIIFKSNVNCFDTFAISQIINGYDEHDKQYHYEVDDIDIDYAGHDSIKKKFFLNNDILLKIKGYSIVWGDFCYSSSIIAHDSVVINGCIFLNVDELVIDTNIFVDVDLYKIYFSRNFGVLKYWYLDKSEYGFYKVLLH
jgi:hypothetical protein